MTPRPVAPRLTVTGLHKAFAGHAVLGPVDLTASAGTVVTVTGPPGAGTTTLARCLTGTYRPDGGTVLIGTGDDAVDLASADTRTVAWLRTHHLAALDGPLAAPPRRAAAAAVARITGHDERAAADILDRAGAGHLAATPIGRLRGDERLRVALAAALGRRAPIVVLDDPGTDPAIARWIAETAASGRIVIAVSGDHRRPPIPRNADARVATGHLENGAIRWQEP